MTKNASRTAARAYLAAIVDDPRARPADRLRAAEALLRSDDIMPVGGRVARLMTDAELEAIARGEGGTPPERGPVSGVPETGPIREREDNPTCIGTVPERTLPTPARRGRPKRGPQSGTPGPVLVPAATSGDDVDPLS